jgi:hypothetical protein
MEFSDFIIIILLIICLIMWVITYTTKCPPQTQLPPQIIYKYNPELDLQFDERNFPSKIYNDVFSGENVYMGGYKLDQAKKTQAPVQPQPQPQPQESPI